MNPQPMTPAPPGRILVRGVNWLGDAVMSTPALLRLRELFPNAHIAILTPAKLQDLWKKHPAVNQTIAFGPGRSVWSVAAQIRSAGPLGESFDLAVVLPGSPRSALETFLARIPRRIGYAGPWRNLFLTHALPPRPGHIRTRKLSRAQVRKLVANASTGKAGWNLESHQVHDYLHLVAQLGANPQPLPPRLFVDADDLEPVKARFGLAGNAKPLVAIVPGAEYGPAKRWPAERFTAAAQAIQKRIDCAWILLGVAGDAAVASGVEVSLRSAGLRIQNLAGQTSLAELCALLKLSRVVLSNDTGAMHAAAALGTPVVVPFGSTSPELTGPGLPGDTAHRLLKSAAPCSPCFRRTCPIDFRCMTGITVDELVNAALEILHPTRETVLPLQ
jgi:heptosyltransferase-2